MLDVNTTADKTGAYRFTQDGASGRIYKGAKNGVASRTGSLWFMEIDGEDAKEGFATKAEAEEAANRRTRAGYAFYGETVTKVEALGLAYLPLNDGEADLSVRSATGELIEIHLSPGQRARLLKLLATDFADDVIYGNVTFKPEEN